MNIVFNATFNNLSTISW